ELIIARIADGVQRFQRAAMLRYGNFVHAYRTLSRIESIEEIGKELGSACQDPTKLITAFKKRSARILEIDPIARDQTYLIGYLSARQIVQEKTYADLLLAAAREVQSGKDPSWDALSKRISEGSKEAVRPDLLTIITKYRKRNAAHCVKNFTAALETE